MHPNGTITFANPPTTKFITSTLGVRPSCGWKKGCPMTTPTELPYAVTVHGKMYVLGRFVAQGFGCLGAQPRAEVFDGKGFLTFSLFH
ncbi:hypothetical protein RHMOL_Rhmol01G0006600 [Rhododendron molle]|uniref:Uncharacterized protein n=1 Tax=Rhododendron molle TaxID=49168 RepID=A0ACC0PWI5_RHOML|nr:hypothetical protein RHMOL_Rhmol01G0006600 [Rhododendron molle]